MRDFSDFEIKVNLISLIGIIIVVVSCILPWANYSYNPNDLHDSEILMFLAQHDAGDNPIHFISGNLSYAFESNSNSDNDIIIPLIASWAMIIGIIIAIITPLGGIILSIAEAALANSILGPHGGFWFGSQHLQTFEMSLSIGFLVAIIGTVIILASLMIPFGLGVGIKGVPIRSKIFTWRVVNIKSNTQ